MTLSVNEVILPDKHIIKYYSLRQGCIATEEEIKNRRKETAGRTQTDSVAYRLK